MVRYDLMRFVAAQDPVWPQILAELSVGMKRSHWMWFVFPQLEGLGSSDMAHRFAISGLEEAEGYLAHPLLGPRLVEAVSLVLGHPDRPIQVILGVPDDLKFRSCLTLFRAAARDQHRALFDRALAVFYDGEPCGRTLAMLARA